MNVLPVVTSDADRYSQYPAYAETFSTDLNGAFWTKTGDFTITDGAAVLSGGAVLTNKSIPGRITAGDNYAQKQVWEITFSVNSPDIKAVLFGYGNNDLRIENGSIEYSQNGTFAALASILPNTTYTLRREVDLAEKTSSFYLYDAAGAELAKATNISTQTLPASVSDIMFWVSSDSADHKLTLDNYKLYPLGVTMDFELYDAATGYKVTKATNEGDIAYRLSWMNASDRTETATIVADFYDGETLVSQKTIREFVMAPGSDGVETEIVPLSEGKTMALRLEVTKPTDDPMDAPGSENPGTTDKPAAGTTNQPENETDANAPQAPAQDKEKGLSAGMIALIVVAAVVVVAAAVLFVVKKRIFYK